LVERSAAGIRNIHESGIPSDYAGALNEAAKKVPGVCTLAKGIKAPGIAVFLS
jgi:hypothetical protein